MREYERLRETTLVELAAIVIKCEILDNLECKDMLGIVDELVECRVNEMNLDDTKISYTEGVEAFTCEVFGNQIYVMKHSTIDNAIRYSVENIGEINVIYNNDIVVFGGASDGEAHLRFNGAQVMVSVGWEK